MFEIVRKEALNPTVMRMDIRAPLVAKKAKAGQFVILRADERGERIPLTVAGCDREAGTVTIIFQIVGGATMTLATLKEGGCVADFVGPLGTPTHIEGLKKVAVVGGGVGCAIAFPQAKALYRAGAHVDVIVGFRTKELVFLEKSFRRNCTNLFITTDDGTYGEKGFVSDKLQQLLDGGNQYDLAIAIGPIPMMRAISNVTKPFGLKTIVSLNPIMVDGTGICGGCQVNVGGETKFACVDGPDFDGHLVNYDELIVRNSVYREHEAQAKAVHDHACRMQQMALELEKGGMNNG